MVPRMSVLEMAYRERETDVSSFRKIPLRTRSTRAGLNGSRLVLNLVRLGHCFPFSSVTDVILDSDGCQGKAVGR